MGNIVLDSYAVLAFLFKKKGHEIMLDLFEEALEANNKLLGAARWNEIRDKLLGLPIKIIEVDQGLAETAGEIKASHKMSLADCFAAALARREQGLLYTGDPEFKSVETEQKIVWL